MPQRLGCCDGTEPWRRTSLAADLLTEARGEADKLATPLTEDDLVDLFGRLGAPSPEDWARSQVTEGIPQLARFLFLKQAWSNVVSEGDTAWIQNEIRSAKLRPNDP